MAYRVVIIDDEAWTRDTIKRIGHWKEYGFQIVGEAADGASGLECINALKPHLIITDMKMPGLDGVALLQLLTQMGSQAKIIVVSGFYDYNYTRQALNSHVLDYLLKPIKEEEFNEQLRRCAQMLEPETNGGETGEIGIVGDIDKGWLKEYIETRNDVRKCLESLSLKGIERSLEKMKELLNDYHEKKMMLKLIIRINYDLQRIVEENIISQHMELVENALIGEISYTIHESTTYDKIITHYQVVTKKIIETALAERQRKNRLDIRSILRFIDGHFNQNISLARMAEENYISKEYLSAAFKKEVGITFSEYLTKVRMEKAKELIVQYGIPIQKVAEQLGYMEIAHFYKTFKKFYGTSPAKMRKDIH